MINIMLTTITVILTIIGFFVFVFLAFTNEGHALLKLGWLLLIKGFLLVAAYLAIPLMVLCWFIFK